MIKGSVLPARVVWQKKRLLLHLICLLLRAPEKPLFLLTGLRIHTNEPSPGKVPEEPYLILSFASVNCFAISTTTFSRNPSVPLPGVSSEPTLGFAGYASSFLGVALDRGPLLSSWICPNMPHFFDRESFSNICAHQFLLLDSAEPVAPWPQLHPYLQDGSSNSAFQDGSSRLIPTMKNIGDPSYVSALRRFANQCGPLGFQEYIGKEIGQLEFVFNFYSEFIEGLLKWCDLEFRRILGLQEHARELEDSIKLYWDEGIADVHYLKIMKSEKESFLLERDSLKTQVNSLRSQVNSLKNLVSASSDLSETVT